MPFERYGEEWPDGTTDLTIELIAFTDGWAPEDGGLGKVNHFWNLVEMLWNRPGSPKRFERHPWAERMAEAACEHDYLSVAGCASSGKTDFFAVWGILNYLGDPRHTMVLVTSTSLKDSRKRIWGAIRDYWQAVPGLPGKLVDSLGLIRFEEEGVTSSDRCGITLIAAEKKREKDAVGKMIGFKNKRVLVICDELPELSEAILEACYSNLAPSARGSGRYFQLIGIGNPNSYYDPFGVFSKPMHGWSSISPMDEEWETEKGYCIRFDGERSPNILAGEELYPWMITQEKIDQAKKDLGPDSLAYWRMMRGFWCPTGGSDGIYSEADIIRNEAEKTPVWLEPPIKVAALDPAFTNGGDRCPLYFGLLGRNQDGLVTLCYDEYVLLSEEVAIKDEPRAYQIVRQFRQHCEDREIPPHNVAFDATGGGAPFGDVVAALWSSEVLRVNFGGKASDMKISALDKKKGSERYVNRVTEIWFSGKEFLRTGQLKGISRDLAKEMCSRTYSTEKTTQMRVKVESKIEMRSRMGKSPDLADAAFILLDLCRQRFGLSSAERPADFGKKRLGWKHRVRMNDVAGRSGRALIYQK